MTLGYIGFDIETAKPFPSGENWRDHRPLGITCAAIWRDPNLNQTWFSKNPDGSPADRMSQEDVGAMLDRLIDLQNEGYTITTWNGLGFDFDVLSEESGRHDECVDLALGHVDMMFHMFCDKGYPVGLNAVATHMRVGSKTAGVSGAEAGQMWKRGEHDKVLKYVLNDARLTAELASRCETANKAEWRSRSGRIQFVRLRTGWSSAGDAIDMPDPDVSWMDNPIDRNDFSRWIVRE